MSRDLGRDVPDLEKLYAGKLWADFSYPKTQNNNAYWGHRFLCRTFVHLGVASKVQPELTSSSSSAKAI